MNLPEICTFGPGSTRMDYVLVNIYFHALITMAFGLEGNIFVIYRRRMHVVPQGFYIG